MPWFKEFFENDKGELSMSRLVLFGSFLGSSIVMFGLLCQKLMSEGYFTAYLGAFVGGYASKLYKEYKVKKVENVAPPVA